MVLGKFLEGIRFQLPRCVLIRDVDAHILHLVDEYYIVTTHRACKKVAGRESQLLYTNTVEPGSFLAAGGPEDLVTQFVDHHIIKADGTDGPTTPQCWNLLNRVMVNAEGLEGPEVLIEHSSL